ncbi:MAG: VWA domain-containing protein [Blastocatellia bacterium]|nr:VWA domain-containing protein [Blastocatellia bacterium]
MRRRLLLIIGLGCALFCGALPFTAATQEIAIPEFTANLVIPQTGRVFLPSSRRGTSPVTIRSVKADILVVEQVAATTLDITLSNQSGQPQEAELLVPVPPNSALRSTAMLGGGRGPTAQILPKAEAKQLYLSIVSKLKDPLLVEFAGYNLLRSSVFPVPAGGEQTIRLVYEQLLKAEGSRVDYVLPRSESFDSAKTPWTVSAVVKSARRLAAIYSPSHPVTSERTESGAYKVHVINQTQMEPGPFRLSIVTDSDGLGASLMTYPDSTGTGGYFLLLAGAPARPAEIQKTAERSVNRELTFVLDRSGSMQGQKFQQARSAAVQVLEGLNQGEAFNIIDYSDRIERFAPQAVLKDDATLEKARQYLNRLQPGGGTNLHDALLEGVKQPVTPNMLPLILFLTDGLPTVGVTQEAVIRQHVQEANTRNRRIFTFGVGYDVNAPLLDGLAAGSRAASTFVHPNDNVEAKVSEVFKKLNNPTLVNPKLEVLDASGAVTTRAVQDLLPTELPDLYEDDQFVLLGRYQGEGPLTFRISGTYLGQPRTFAFKFDFKRGSKHNNFVPRLWASRKIGFLIQEIAQAGALGKNQRNEGRMKELVDEIVRLSTEFGILTEYTAFLATEGTDLTRRDLVLVQLQAGLEQNAQQIRSGAGGISQVENNVSQRSQTTLNRSNAYVAQNNQRVELTTVRQISDQTFFKRGSNWIDSRILQGAKEIKPDQVVEFGSPEFLKLLEQLVAEGRQATLAQAENVVVLINGKKIQIKMP